MSMKKAFDQTIRDLKREVNKKVLKVPSVEQKVLDATSNEPWGPHGSLLAHIAQSSRNYHEYQMIMAVIWKRINDTGKNWRHVYKALTVLEYLVAHGSERVIDDIREHAYQISTLSDFQYIDSSGRDQGNNVRRKSQSLVILVNDKERIQEVRQKAATNRDKFHSASAVGGMYRPSSYSGSDGYGVDRYEGRYDGRDDEKYSRYGDSYNSEGDRYGRETDERYGRDSSRDNDSKGRSQSVGSRSSDRDRDRAYDDDDRHSSRGSSVKVEDHSQDGRQFERKFSEQNLGAPPSYEEVVGHSRSPTYSERDRETPAASVPQSSSPTGSVVPQSSSPTHTVNPSQITAEQSVLSHSNVVAGVFDEFDPRGSISAAPSTSSSINAEIDFLGSLSDAFSPNPLAIMPVSSGTADLEADAMKMASNPTFSAPISDINILNQSFEDPFGDSPFKAIPADELSTHPQNFSSMSSFEPAVNTLEHTQSSNLEVSDSFPGLTFDPTNVPNAQISPNSPFLSHESHSFQDDDILAGILPPSEPRLSTASQEAFPTSTGLPPPTPFLTSTGQPPAGLGFMPQNTLPYSTPPTAINSNIALQAPTGISSHQNNDFLGDFLPQGGPTIPSSLHSAPSSSTGSLALVPQQPSKEKFEPKSAVWADTLSRGLVNLNISGSKINPLSDIGIDFESLNRKEKRMEKPSTTSATSNVTMGKAMGSGSGIGRAGAGALRPQPNPMMASGMGMPMGMRDTPSVGMGMQSYGSMNQQPMGMGMGMGMNMGSMGMNMGMGQGGVQMQPSNGLTPGSDMNGYNPMMGRGGYPQQPYGGGYR